MAATGFNPIAGAVEQAATAAAGHQSTWSLGTATAGQCTDDWQTKAGVYVLIGENGERARD